MRVWYRGEPAVLISLNGDDAVIRVEGYECSNTVPRWKLESAAPSETRSVEDKKNATETRAVASSEGRGLGDVASAASTSLETPLDAELLDAAESVRRVAGLLVGYMDALRHGAQLHANDFHGEPETLNAAAGVMERHAEQLQYAAASDASKAKEETQRSAPAGDGVSDEERDVYVAISRELLPNLGEWSEPVRIRVVEQDGRRVMLAVKYAGISDGLPAGLPIANAERDGLRWTITTLRTALENWGRHHDWCVPAIGSCSCGLIAARETGYEVGAGMAARDPALAAQVHQSSTVAPPRPAVPDLMQALQDSLRAAATPPTPAIEDVSAND